MAKGQDIASAFPLGYRNKVKGAADGRSLIPYCGFFFFLSHTLINAVHEADQEPLMAFRSSQWINVFFILVEFLLLKKYSSYVQPCSKNISNSGGVLPCQPCNFVVFRLLKGNQHLKYPHFTYLLRAIARVKDACYLAYGCHSTIKKF